MSDVIQRLLEVERNARRIISDAEREAARTVEEARREARRIVAEGRQAAQREADEDLRERVEQWEREKQARLDAEAGKLLSPEQLDPGAMARAVDFVVQVVAGQAPG